MKTHPICKINLGLSIVARRTDGYHDLETVFYPVPLADELEIEEATADAIEVQGIELQGPTDDNLVMRAVRLLRQEGCDVPPVSIRLVKNIPSGAGLGGGSSDAAYALRMLNEMFALGLSAHRLRLLSARLGADCAFFVDPRPMLATGIGDILSPIDLDLRGLHLAIVKPTDFISTREAFARVSPRRPERSLSELSREGIGEWHKWVTNDFEASVFPAHPNVAKLKQQLYDCGAVYAAMSGSGSSVYGLFPKAEGFPSPTVGEIHFWGQL